MPPGPPSSTTAPGSSTTRRSRRPCPPPGSSHDSGGKGPALDYPNKLQCNNVGPSSSTSKLAPKVDKGGIHVADGDVQTDRAQSRSMPNPGIWFPAKRGGKPTDWLWPTGLI
ncbi:hypothetical protein HUT19_37180 [Streptomyces sp. NA02950]|uniref:hypothetical protein n=1 Tax=Streptomyces sp. NA02950 TaxID=2742137 RepID=UPI00159010F7|nr:hypothetical protein HUT19_37180 [Streptomyces sp. NA02950]